MKKVCITGSNGFIGRHLVKGFLQIPDCKVISASRTIFKDDRVESVLIDENFTTEQWRSIVRGCDLVIHAAARAHILNEQCDDPSAEYEKINVSMSCNLAEASQLESVKQFIFLSTVGVHGESTKSVPFDESSPVEPVSEYARSKHKAEVELKKIANKSSMILCILRLPLVYGPGVSANFLSMIKVVDQPLPLPFSGLTNKRSFLAVGNLLDAIKSCMLKPSVSNDIFILADDKVVSTTELIAHISNCLGRKPRLFFVGKNGLMLASRLLGQSKRMEKLVSSLVVDATRFKRAFSWEPPESMESAMEDTVSHYKNTKGRSHHAG